MLDFLRSEDSGDFVSPTRIGEAYGDFKKGWGNHDYHSSIASPIMKNLVALGLVERNYRGHYRALPTKP